jgi:mRNA interferase MazF
MKKGDIVLVNLFHGIGHEQYSERPAILISDTKTGMAIIIPLTTNIKALRLPYALAISSDDENNLSRQSIALIFQIRAIDKIRIIRILGSINKDLQNKIDKILKEMFQL